MGVVAAAVPSVSNPAKQAMPGTAVIIVDPKLRIVRADGPAIDTHGHRAEDWPGRLLTDVLPADQTTMLEPYFRAALAGEFQSFDYWSHDGSRAYSAQITPIRGQTDAVTLVVAVMQDITERVRTNDELSVSEARLQESERMVGVGSWEMPLETREIAYSGGYARLLGLSPGEPLNGAHFLARVHHDDRPIVAQAIADCRRTGASICEHRLTRADGAIRTISAHSELVPTDVGRADYMRGTILDVTDARVAENDRMQAMTLFQQGFDAAPIGMVLTDPLEWRAVRVNDAMCRLLGRSREYLMGLSVDGVTHPDDQDADHRCRRGMLAGTLASAQLDKRYLRSDGETVWVTLHITPVRAADGSVQAFFSQVIDITERKERGAV